MGAESVLPGGRLLAPLGRQHLAGAGAFSLAVSPNGRRIATADIGRETPSITVLERVERTVRRQTFTPPADGTPAAETDDWRSVSTGIVFDGNGRLMVSEGNTGRVRVLQATNGRKVRTYDLNQAGYADSYSAGLALDSERRLLYVVDQANFRLAVLDTRSGRVLQSLPVGRLPRAVALSPDRQQAFVTNSGLYSYQPLPGASQQRAGETGLPFPAFGAPSTEAQIGVTRENALGPVAVPPLGDPNAPEANSVTVVDLTTPGGARVLKHVRTGQPLGGRVVGGSSPAAVLATNDWVYVANTYHDTISILDRKTLTLSGEIPLQIPGLESLRGILPSGLALDEQAQLLYVAEAGVNAIAVVDTKARRVLGHLPTGSLPAAVAVQEGVLWVANAKGLGMGPSATMVGPLPDVARGALGHGTISEIAVPARDTLPRHTEAVLALNGMAASGADPEPLPAGLRYVVVILKENRSFDELFGDLRSASNGPVNGAAGLARFGALGYAEPERSGLTSRRDVRDLLITPNHRALAHQFAFSDNFYADSAIDGAGHHWLVGAYPNLDTEASWLAAGTSGKDFRLASEAPGRLYFAERNASVHPEQIPQAGTLWSHLEAHGVSFRNFGEGFELAGVDQSGPWKPTGARVFTNVPMPDALFRNTSRNYPGYNTYLPDQYRVDQWIAEIEQNYVQSGKDLPRLLFLHLPNDHMPPPRPGDGYPFRASYLADNDLALGRIVSYLSQSKWWNQMAVFITEDDATGGLDHVDAQRVPMLVVSPFAKPNYVSHRNVSFPGLLKTVLRILKVPPMNLYDVTATDLADCFQPAPEPRIYRWQPVDRRLFDPEAVVHGGNSAPAP